ncbi:MAG: hypothetical protein ACJ772_09950 [Gemmatimonadaceae bacterium]
MTRRTPGKLQQQPDRRHYVVHRTVRKIDGYKKLAGLISEQMRRAA